VLALPGRRGPAPVAPALLGVGPARPPPSIAPPAVEDDLDEGDVPEPLLELPAQVGMVLLHHEEPAHPGAHSDARASGPGAGASDSGSSGTPSPRSRMIRDRYVR
jgi:hypothetical protein